MKKSLIALAVASALTVPAIASADATLYGAVAVDGVFKNDTSADIQVDDAIIGLKGDVDLGMDGVTGFFNIRTELAAEGAIGSGGSSLTTDRALVGIKGGFGVVQGGAMGNPVDAVESLDRAYDSYSTDNWFLNPDDLQSALAYVSPNMGGFTGYAGIVMDGGIEDGTVATPSGDDENVDGYLLGFNYAIGGFTADVGYWDFDKEGTVGLSLGVADADYIGVSLDYAINSNWSVTGNWAESEVDDSVNKAETQLWGLGTEYTMGKTVLGLTYVDFEAELNGVKTNASGDEWALLATHNLSNRAKVYAAYSDADVDAGTVAGDSVLTIGYGLSF
ncbi:porin [Nitrincola iocasae]|uniref:Porin n=1 Tax=Nitrincola iocasae TaxID=2614693 RepID=A0A5J6LBR6_9GAMM|nr:porin [Nitrincola iocasae]QEW06015.1 porin [Nitrincola iocasae]